jgi:lactobin A/cerein 7B family class IIb bacteriocin
MGVQELDAVELKQTGGGWWTIVGTIIGAVCLTIYVVDNLDKGIQGWNDGAAAANK